MVRQLTATKIPLLSSRYLSDPKRVHVNAPFFIHKT
jgi:hypothetical protein